jgi:septal ring factor EnvC (AmiA/AmiB activator)
MSKVVFAVPSAGGAVDVRKAIQNAYKTRTAAIQTLEELKVAGEALAASKVDVWASDVASRGVDVNAVVGSYETTQRELEAQQKKIQAVTAMLALVEQRIKQLKTTNATDVVEVLKQQIASLQKEKTENEKDVEEANDMINSLWKEVRELDSDAPSTSAKKK